MLYLRVFYSFNFAFPITSSWLFYSFSLTLFSFNVTVSIAVNLARTPGRQRLHHWVQPIPDARLSILTSALRCTHPTPAPRHFPSHLLDQYFPPLHFAASSDARHGWNSIKQLRCQNLAHDYSRCVALSCRGLRFNLNEPADKLALNS